MLTASQIGGIFKVQYLNKEVRNQAGFLHIDKKHVGTVAFGGRGQACPNDRK